MYLKSLTLKGFKSFPDRTTLEFGRSKKDSEQEAARNALAALDAEEASGEE